jgi:hypothetical protein
LWGQPDEDDGTPQVVKGTGLADGSDVEHHATVEFNPEEIIGRNFLTHIDTQGHRIRIQIAQVLEDEQMGSEASKAKTRFWYMAADDNTYYDISPINGSWTWDHLKTMPKRMYGGLRALLDTMD